MNHHILFHLNRASSRTSPGYKAPHKPVLLLALIQEVDEGRITDNKVFITPELLASFKEIWSRLVEGHWNCKFFLPFYHMQNDKPKFWFIKTMRKYKWESRAFIILGVK